MKPDRPPRLLFDTLRSWVLPGLPADISRQFHRHILLINYRRLQLILPILFFVAGMLIFVDLYYYREIGGTRSVYRLFFWLDTLLVLGLCLFYTVVLVTRPAAATDIRPRHRLVIGLFLGFIMIWCGMVAAVEEAAGNSGVTLIIGSFAVAVSTLLRGGPLLFLFFLELLAFRVSWEWLELDGAPFPFSHIYLIGLMALAWTVSRILYYGQLRQLKVASDLKASSENLERRVAERTRDLSEANRRLEKEMAIRKQVLTNLQESEAKFRALTETVTSAIFIIQGERFVYVNPATEAILQYPRHELVGMEFWRIVHPEDRETVVSRGMARQRGERVISRYEFRVVNRSGETRWADFSAGPIEFEGAPAIMGTAFDITDLKLALEALEESEEKYRLLVEHANDAILIIQKGRIIFANPQTLASLKCSPEDLSKTDFQEFIHPEDRETAVTAYRRRLKGELPNTPYDLRIIDREGQEIWGQVNAVPIQWEGAPASLNFIRNITDQKRLEDQFHHAQRMEAIGALAGGVAHDVNNLLMGIQGYVSLMLFNLDSDHPHHEKLKNIEASVESGAGLTRQLLGFARGGKYEVKITDLNRLVREKTRMFSATRKELTLHESYGESVLSVMADPGQMEQVLLNLYINAWQAMPDGGDLTIETGNVRLDNSQAAMLGVAPGTYVNLSVTDTGVGMPPAVRERIFEPFFTTKERGRGTGLGLASTYGIVKNHGGAIRVFSEPGRGTAFEIYLPAVAEAVPEAEAPGAESVMGGTETILLVDDEKMLQEVGRELLKRLGYQVLTAGCGEEALALFREKGEGVDMVILDMIMPAMSGSETYDRLKAIDGNVRVLLATGYSLDGQAMELLARGCNGFIQKPFKLADLSRKIREVLTASA